MRATAHHAYVTALATELHTRGWPVIESQVNDTRPMRGWLVFDSLAEGLERSDRARILIWDEEDGWSYARESWEQPGQPDYRPNHFGGTLVPALADLLEWIDHRHLLDLIECGVVHDDLIESGAMPADGSGRERPRYRRHSDPADLSGEFARALGVPC